MNLFRRIHGWWRCKKHYKHLKELEESGIYVVYRNINGATYKCRFNSLPQAIDNIRFYPSFGFSSVWSVSHLETNGKIMTSRDIQNAFMFEEEGAREDGEDFVRKRNIIMKLGE